MRPFLPGSDARASARLRRCPPARCAVRVRDDSGVIPCLVSGVRTHARSGARGRWVVAASLAALAASALVACGGGSDASAEAEAAVQEQYPSREVSCSKSDVEYGGGPAYSCTLGRKPICVALVDGELLELWDERPLRPGERGYSDQFIATVRDGPSC